MICLEALSAETIGCSVPCGHCFHVECFQHYKRQTRGRLACPTCKTETTTFIRIFLDSEGSETVDLTDDSNSSRTTNALKKRLNELNKFIRTQNKTIATLQNDQEEIQLKLHRMSKQYDRVTVQLEDARLDVTTSRRELEDQKAKTNEAVRLKLMAETNLKECKDSYQIELKRASGQGMTEMQSITREHAKLVDENRRLKEHLRIAKGKDRSSYDVQESNRRPTQQDSKRQYTEQSAPDKKRTKRDENSKPSNKEIKNYNKTSIQGSRYIYIKQANDRKKPKVSALQALNLAP